MSVINAKEFVDPNGLIVESGSLAASAIVDLLKAGEDVEVSLIGLRGLSSSYFNIIFERVVSACGVEALNNRVRFKFDSTAQEHVFARSRAVVETKSA